MARISSDIIFSVYTKVGGKKRADGKLLKPEGWIGPEAEIEKELIKQKIAKGQKVD